MGAVDEGEEKEEVNRIDEELVWLKDEDEDGLVLDGPVAVVAGYMVVADCGGSNVVAIITECVSTTAPLTGLHT